MGARLHSHSHPARKATHMAHPAHHRTVTIRIPLPRLPRLRAPRIPWRTMRTQWALTAYALGTVAAMGYLLSLLLRAG